MCNGLIENLKERGFWTEIIHISRNKVDLMSTYLYFWFHIQIIYLTLFHFICGYIFFQKCYRGFMFYRKCISAFICVELSSNLECRVIRVIAVSLYIYFLRRINPYKILPCIITKFWHIFWVEKNFVIILVWKYDNMIRYHNIFRIIEEIISFWYEDGEKVLWKYIKPVLCMLV